jgi:hypothetical protein
MTGFPQIRTLRTSLLPASISTKEIERVSRPAVRRSIMREFQTNLASKDLKVSARAAQLTAENLASYGVIAGALAAQMPLIIFGSWQPLPVVFSRLPAVAQQMTKVNSAANYLAMEAFNAGVKATAA